MAGSPRCGSRVGATSAPPTWRRPRPGPRWDRGAGVAAGPAARRVGLRVLREAAGLTQLELAAASGLRHETLSRLELGRQAASAESVRRLARALQVEPERFVSREPGGVTMLTVAEAAFRLDVPADRLRTWLQERELRWGQGLGAVAGAGDRGGRAGPQWAAPGSLPPPRPALPGLSGCRDGGTAFVPHAPPIVAGCLLNSKDQYAPKTIDPAPNSLETPRCDASSSSQVYLR